MSLRDSSKTMLDSSPSQTHSEALLKDVLLAFFRPLTCTFLSQRTNFKPLRSIMLQLAPSYGCSLSTQGDFTYPPFLPRAIGDRRNDNEGNSVGRRARFHDESLLKKNPVSYAMLMPLMYGIYGPEQRGGPTDNYLQCQCCTAGSKTI